MANYNASNICVEKECNAPDVPPGGTSEALHITTLLHIYKGKMRTAADVPPGGTSAALHITRIWTRGVATDVMFNAITGVYFKLVIGLALLGSLYKFI